MTGEMPPTEMPPASLPAVPAHGMAARPVDDPRAAQILATEHWSLLAGRSLSYNEAFTRTGMFLTFLSASLIVVGFLIASDRFAEAVIPIVVLLLAVDLFIGLATFGRLVDAGSEELAAVKGMNRIRHAYTEMIPGIQRYFVSSIHDDMKGVLSVYGSGEVGPPSAVATLVHGLTTTIGMVAAICCVIVAALIAMISLGLGATVNLALGAGVAGFVLAFVAFAMVGYRSALQGPIFDNPMFPSPPDAPPES